MKPGPRVKMIIGALLILLGVWWYIPGSLFTEVLVPHSSLTNFQSLVAAVQGSAGIILLLVGVFVVWIEHDEIRMRRELQTEEVGHTLQRTVKTVAKGGGDGGDGNGEEQPSAHDQHGEHGAHKEGNGQDDQEYTCDTCEKTFDTEHGLKVHAAQVHE